jgi:predicted transcriptional regulator YheO
MSNGLFKRSGVRYEVACDVIGAVIAHHSEVVATELDKAEPDPAVIAAAEAAKKALRDTREALDTRDAAGIEAAIATYGPQARALYQ